MDENYRCEKTAALSPDARAIRTAVFVDEQGFIAEFDACDDIARHLVFYDGETPFGVCRYYEGEGRGEFVAGRIALIKSYRGRGAGSYLMAALEKNIAGEGGSLISLSAQCRAQGFYEKNGYRASGGIYLDEGREHIRMTKEITAPAAGGGPRFSYGWLPFAIISLVCALFLVLLYFAFRSGGNPAGLLPAPAAGSELALISPNIYNFFIIPYTTTKRQYRSTPG